MTDDGTTLTWKRETVRLSCGESTRRAEADVLGDWAVHRFQGVSSGATDEWSVTYVPTGQVVPLPFGFLWCKEPIASRDAAQRLALMLHEAQDGREVSAEQDTPWVREVVTRWLEAGGDA